VRRLCVVEMYFQKRKPENKCRLHHAKRGKFLLLVQPITAVFVHTNEAFNSENGRTLPNARKADKAKNDTQQMFEEFVARLKELLTQKARFLGIFHQKVHR
jgi:IS4 transposase